MLTMSANNNPHDCVRMIILMLNQSTSMRIYTRGATSYFVCSKTHSGTVRQRIDNIKRLIIAWKLSFNIC